MTFRTPCRKGQGYRDIDVDKYYRYRGINGIEILRHSSTGDIKVYRYRRYRGIEIYRCRGIGGIQVQRYIDVEVQVGQSLSGIGSREVEWYRRYIDIQWGP